MEMSLDDFIKLTRSMGSALCSRGKVESIILEDKLSSEKWTQSMKAIIKDTEIGILDVEKKIVQENAKISEEKINKLSESNELVKKLEQRNANADAELEIAKITITKLNKELIVLQSEMQKKNNKREKILNDYRDRYHIYKNLTGICLDYDKITLQILEGYAQNKRTCRIQSFSLTPEESKRKHEASETIWSILYDLSK